MQVSHFKVVVSNGIFKAKLKFYRSNLVTKEHCWFFERLVLFIEVQYFSSNQTFLVCLTLKPFGNRCSMYCMYFLGNKLKIQIPVPTLARHSSRIIYVIIKKYKFNLMTQSLETGLSQGTAPTSIADYVITKAGHQLHFWDEANPGALDMKVHTVKNANECYQWLNSSWPGIMYYTSGISVFFKSSATDQGKNPKTWPGRVDLLMQKYSRPGRF